jgi:hypothetical protein
MAKTPTWQRKAGKNPNGGLNEAGRRSLKAAGHDIKRPQPEGGSRRDSFCARMKGMKAKLTSSETANDPDSRINKSLRAWNCADGGAIRPELGGGGSALKAAMKLAQEITSAKTSRNQIPGLFNSQLFEALPNHRNLDIGGGKYDRGTEFLKSRGIESHVYDPFNRPAEHNEAVMSQFKENPPDSVTVANVLNVIKEPEIRSAVIQQALDALRPGGKAYFSVYEGNRSGVGGLSTDGWQENRKALEYLDEIKKHFPEAQRKGDIIYGSRPEMGAGGDAIKAAMKIAQNVIKTYHGSPHQFDKFDLDKLGSGVGAQAYGHGLYTSDNPNVARGYRTVIPGRVPNPYAKTPNEMTIGGKPVYSVYKDIERQANNVPITEASKYYDKLDVLERLMHEGDALAIKQAASDEAFSPEAYKWFQTHVEPKLNTPGGLYEINLHADPKKFIDLYSQMSLSDPLRERVASLAQHGLQNADAESAYRDAQEAMKTVRRKDIFGSDLQGALDTLFDVQGSKVREAAGVSPDIKGPEAVARYLNREGYAGFTYPHGLDAPGPELLNRVVFDPKVMEIVKRYAHGGRIHFDEGGLARIEELLRQAKGEEQATQASHPVGMSGNVEFAPVEIDEPITGSKIPLGSLPAPTAAVANPIANILAQYGPYAMGPIPAGMAAAIDLATGIKEGSGLDVATAAIGAPGKLAKYGLPALGAVTDLLSPTEAQAGTGSKLVKGLSSLALRRPELLRAEHPYFPEGFRDKIAGIVSPFSNDEDIAKAAVEMAQKYRTPLENKSNITGGYYGPIQSVDPLNVTRKIGDIPGIKLLTPTPEQTYEDLYKVGKGGTLVNLAGDRSDFGRLTHIGGKKLDFPVDVHAGPKYSLEPNPGEVWANDPSHAGKLKETVAKGEEKGPVIGLYTPMGPQSISSSQHMFEALMAQIKGSGASKDDLDAFDKVIRSGAQFGNDKKNADNAVEYMKGNFGKNKQIGPWPGLSNPKEAAEWAKNLPGHHRAAIVNEMEKARWKKLGFPEVGVTRVALTDPSLMSTPQNLIGGRASMLSSTNPRGAEPLFQHSTYGSPTYGQYLMDLPFVQRQYAMPEAIKKYTSPTETGTVVHPFSEQSLGRGSFRKLFETNFLTQPINQEWLDTLMTGLERQKQYGFNRGGKAN